MCFRKFWITFLKHFSYFFNKGVQFLILFLCILGNSPHLMCKSFHCYLMHSHMVVPYGIFSRHPIEVSSNSLLSIFQSLHLAACFPSVIIFCPASPPSWGAYPQLPSLWLFRRCSWRKSLNYGVHSNWLMLWGIPSGEWSVCQCDPQSPCVWIPHWLIWLTLFVQTSTVHLLFSLSSLLFKLSICTGVHTFHHNVVKNTSSHGKCHPLITTINGLSWIPYLENSVLVGLHQCCFSMAIRDLV